MSLSADAWSAIATAAATVVALGIAVHDVLARRADKRDAEVTQARLVTGWTDGAAVVVRNDSQLPIYEVRFGQLRRATPTPRLAMPMGDTECLYPAEKFRARVAYLAPDHPSSEIDRGGGVTGVFQFLDANGLCWERPLDDRQSSPRRIHAAKRLGDHNEESDRVLTDLYRERAERAQANGTQEDIEGNA